MKTLVPYFSASALVAIALAFSLNIQAQSPALEFAAGAGNPTVTGPTISNQVITFQNNTNNPSASTFVTYAPTLKATFSFSNQQYSLPSTQISTQTGLSFGADINASGSNALSNDLFDLMNSIGSPSNSNFTSATAVNVGTGIDITKNKAVAILTSARALYNAGQSTSGRYYYGDLTITFNQNVTNPVLHVVGLGGFYSNLGFTTELELQTSGVTLSKLSGSSELTISSGKKILNSATHPSSPTGSGAASGSILASGTVSTLKFKVYLRGDGGQSTWGASTMHTGDLWLIAVSIRTPTLVGLPVSLVDFAAKYNKPSVSLTWSTVAEHNFSHFVVEHSTDGTNFTQTAVVFGSGESDSRINYSYTDKDMKGRGGVIYYRLKQVDIDGSFSYSAVRMISLEAETTSLALTTYPNPVVNELRINFPASWQNKQVTIDLFSTSGQHVNNVKIANSSATTSIPLASLQKGIYFVKAYCGTETATQQVVKN